MNMLHKNHVFWDNTVSLGEQLLTAWPWRERNCDLLKFWELLSQQHSVTSKYWIFSETAVKIFNLTCCINEEKKECGGSLREMEWSSCTWMEQIKMGNLWRKNKNRISWRRRWQKEKLTSGSPVQRFVWIRILPIRMSLHTSHTACSMVSPALKMDTPQILSLADRFPWYITPCGVSTTCSCKNSSLMSTIRTVAQRGHLPTLQLTQILLAFF